MARRRQSSCRINEDRRGKVADWYYIGHYGQLGPLTREQMEDLSQGGVIARDTYVWHSGLDNWRPAEHVPDLQNSLSTYASASTPPPPPIAGTTPAPPYGGYATSGSYTPSPTAWNQPNYPRLESLARSDRSRVVGGILNLIFPGVGRMYLGYAAIGVLQFVVTIMTCGVGALWPFIDGIIVLSGGVKLDGYGRVMND